VLLVLLDWLPLDSSQSLKKSLDLLPLDWLPSTHTPIARFGYRSILSKRLRLHCNI
jgi:hypothetical protein